MATNLGNHILSDTTFLQRRGQRPSHDLHCGSTDRGHTHYAPDHDRQPDTTQSSGLVRGVGSGLHGNEDPGLDGARAQTSRDDVERFPDGGVTVPTEQQQDIGHR